MDFKLSKKEKELLEKVGLLEGEVTEEKLSQIFHSLIKEKEKLYKNTLDPLPTKGEYDNDEYFISEYKKLITEIESIKDPHNSDYEHQNVGSRVLDYEQYHIEGDDHRWDRDMTSYCLIGGRYFRLEWSKGLTEIQDNWFNSITEVVYKGVKNSLGVYSQHIFEELKHE